MSHTIRLAEPSDIDALLPAARTVQHLHADAQPARYRADITEAEWRTHFETSMTAPHGFVLMDKAACGYLIAERIVKEANFFGHASTRGYLQQISVIEAARGRGLASALIDEMKRRFRAAGYTQWTASHIASNHASSALLHKAGAEPFLVSVEGDL